MHVASNLFNDYYDVKDGTDGANTKYFNAGLNSTMLEGAQLSGGSRAVELGLITHIGTLSLARKMLIVTRKIYDNYNINTQILAASIRSPLQIINCAKIGSDVITSPLNSILKLFQHPLTDIGLKKFLDDHFSINKK